MAPFCPLYFRAPLLKPNSRKKGTLIVKRVLMNREGAQRARLSGDRDFGQSFGLGSWLLACFEMAWSLGKFRATGFDCFWQPKVGLSGVDDAPGPGNLSWKPTSSVRTGTRGLRRRPGGVA